MRTSVYTACAAAVLCTMALVVAQEVMVTRGQPSVPESKGLGLEPNISISKNNREAVCKLLNALLADEYLLYVKTQNYHWNVTGLMFNDLHLFFGNNMSNWLNCRYDC